MFAFHGLRQAIFRSEMGFKNLLFHHVQGPRQPHATTLFRLHRNASKRNSSQSMRNFNVAPAEFNTSGPISSRNIFKAFVFTGAFSTGCFIAATVLEYENTRSMMIEKTRQAKAVWFKKKQVSNENLSWEHWKLTISRYWQDLTPGEKVFLPICALNLIVFGLWRIPSLKNQMLTYFCSNPAGKAICWPMFLSTFSHYSAFHIFANMYVLHSFSNPAVMSLGKEQFLGFYLSAGVLASFTSILYKAITSQAGLSVGASGAIMAVLAYVCTQYPDTQLSILFLPMVTFSAGAAIKVLMGVDLAGCILGWKFFDHAAHLGGAAFGVFWAYFGREIWQQRLPILTIYHDWRKTK